MRTRLVWFLAAGMAAGITIMVVATGGMIGSKVPGETLGRLYAFYALFGLTWLSITVMAGCILLRRPMKALAEMTGEIDRMAEGHFNTTAVVTGAGEIGALGESLQRMCRSLDRSLGGIIVTSNRLFASGATLDGNAERFAANAAVQTERAHQIATAAEEMSQTIADIARNAANVSDTSRDAVEIVREGKTIAAGAVETADRVHTATTQLSAAITTLNASILEIGTFVTVIEEIADQTNLLALNAAIEAARSGEHGRGFAVVADEVRKLAARTIQATAEISSKIRAVQNESTRTATSMQDASSEVVRTSQGIRQVEVSLDRIVEAFDTVNDKIIGMASAVEQQSATTQQVTTGIEDCSKLSEQMGYMAGEVAQEVKVLGGITDELLLVLGKQRLAAHFRSGEIIAEISANRELLSMERRRQEICLRQMLHTHPFIELLYVTDAHGRQITSNIGGDSDGSASYGSDGFGMDWSNRPWFTGAKGSMGSHITDLYRSMATDTFCFTAATILKDGQDRFLGVLGADINFQRFVQSQGL
ncbi:methyl-accepting chemotaxis protein [Geobacter sp. SVR]|uniref:methyl-accepting chemotaxis protein n=1 Tax=Geobacter sp. SVR TaxID=2495594 RepID=UPI00156341A5|nr:methyl-accepting chemotaxis protein [Geobacter sp. SVR]